MPFSAPSSSSSLAAQALSSWDANAAYWDGAITREGNKYWRRLQEPSLARLLAPTFARAGRLRALELATGNGLGARWLAAKLAALSGGGERAVSEVLATDGSGEMLKVARGYHEDREGVAVRWRKVDVTSEEDLATLATEEGGFDIVLINMALMDVADIDPLARALTRLLKEDGVFVATLLHPVFVTSNAARHVEVRNNPETGNLEVIRSKIIREYMSVPPYMGIAVPGQPEKQVYFHRPMHELFATFFGAGLVMDAMEELAFGEDDALERVEASSNYTQLPFILSFRMRLATGR
ncbi:hypothetical protein VTJ83DRAFT_6331 [Remersonia thermophila]|uniref:Methyltransferase type 11 domain-containing protein n=1 Tax=Remersonia thermophila TaxID=72144 RepID=A0ABR4D4E2_9PEZI